MSTPRKGIHQIELALVSFGKKIAYEQLKEEEEEERLYKEKKSWDSGVYPRELLSAALQYPFLNSDLGIKRMLIASSYSFRHNDCTGDHDDGPWLIVFHFEDGEKRVEDRKRFVTRSFLRIRLYEDYWFAFITKPRR